MFEEPRASAESPEQAPVAIGARIFFCLWAMSVAMLPAIVAAYSSFRVINSFRTLSTAEESGSEWLQNNLHAANTPLWIAFGISALLAFAMALVLTIKPQRRLAGVGLPLSLGLPFLALTPAVLLGVAESKIREILSGSFETFSAMDYALTIPWLLMLAIASAVLVLSLTFLCGVISLFLPPQRRADALSGPRVFIWFVSGVLLLMGAAAFFMLI
ncbi:MAG TPA: hypothetical protein VFM63_06325 [Pyrinomonadaceae bacterium]|nr:hypothetical protein [Pyrinomonadaceae bacterium]